MSQRRNTTTTSSRRRHTAAAAILACAGLAACSSDRVTAPAGPAPSAAPSASTAPALPPNANDKAKRMTDAQLTALMSTFRTAATDIEAPTTSPIDLVCGIQGVYKVSQRVGKSGGTLRFGKSELRVPAGALSADVQISATITLGQGVEVDFAPHGLKFAKPVDLRVDWTGCKLPAGVTGVNLYYTDAYERITQVMPSATTGTTSRMITDHFSGYTVSWGRTTRR